MKPIFKHCLALSIFGISTLVAASNSNRIGIATGQCIDPTTRLVNQTLWVPFIFQDGNDAVLSSINPQGKFHDMAFALGGYGSFKFRCLSSFYHACSYYSAIAWGFEHNFLDTPLTTWVANLSDKVALQTALHDFLGENTNASSSYLEYEDNARQMQNINQNIRCIPGPSWDGRENIMNNETYPVPETVVAQLIPDYKEQLTKISFFDTYIELNSYKTLQTHRVFPPFQAPANSILQLQPVQAEPIRINTEAPATNLRRLKYILRANPAVILNQMLDNIRYSIDPIRSGGRTSSLAQPQNGLSEENTKTPQIVDLLYIQSNFSSEQLGFASNNTWSYIDANHQRCAIGEYSVEEDFVLYIKTIYPTPC